MNAYAIETTYDDGHIEITDRFETYDLAKSYYMEHCSIAHCRIIEVNGTDNGHNDDISEVTI